MDFLAAHLGFTKAETIAFGDGENDLELVEWPDYGIAVAERAGAREGARALGLPVGRGRRRGAGSGSASRLEAVIDLRAARHDPDGYRAALARKGAADAFDELLAVDVRKRELQTQVEELRAKTKPKGKPTPEQLEELRAVKEQLQPLEAELAQSEEALQALLDRVPNPPAEDTPDGDSEDDAVTVKLVGDPPAFDFEPRDHLDLAAAHGWIDVERGGKVSGSRFVYRVGDIALLELALAPLGARPDRREGARARAAAGARPRGGDVRHRVLPVRQGRLLFGPGGRALSRRHVRGADGRVPREGRARRAAASLRRVLDVLPARGGRGRQGHARDVPRAPVRQGRDVRVLRRPTRRATSTSGCSRSRRSSCRSSSCRIAC